MTLSADIANDYLFFDGVEDVSLARVIQPPRTLQRQGITSAGDE